MNTNDSAQRKESNFPLRGLTTGIIIWNLISNRTHQSSISPNMIKEYRISISMMMQKYANKPTKNTAIEERNDFA